MRRIDLANELLLSPSGITRMLDRLGSEGLVENAKCDVDARVTYAVLTDAGAEKLRAAYSVQLAAVERLFGDELSDRGGRNPRRAARPPPRRRRGL